MLFNSLNFAIFLPVVFIIYWFITNKNYKYQNILLLLASYFFYACWNWKFMFLLIFSTLVDYFTGLKMQASEKQAMRKFWLYLSVGINLGFLGLFKYYNFFIESFTKSVNQLGWKVNPATLNIILPVGISFYTFHGLSYVIDIYKRRIHAEKKIIDYAVFVCFFPLLVAGPIERATHLLPQIQQKRIFDKDKAIDGLRQILWGLFKKVVLADSCATYVNMIFNDHASYNGSTHLLGALYFTIQIYCDFSGYSDIAIGTARLFGIELLRNFAFPYFSRDIAEFWRRWHISLSTWFRDYLYIPLGGSKVGILQKIRNTFIIFIVSGFWHGAAWTFVIWGLLHALFIMPSIIFGTNRSNLNIVAQGKAFPSIKELLSMLITFSLAAFAWIFFRSPGISNAISFIKIMFSRSLFSKPQVHPVMLPLMILLFFLIEWQGREQRYALGNLENKIPGTLRWAGYYIMIISILFYAGTEHQFIYFQF